MNRLVGVGAIALGAVLVLAFFIFRGPEEEAVPETVTEPEAPAVTAEPEAAPAAAESAVEPEPAAVAEAEPEPAAVAEVAPEPEPTAAPEPEPAASAEPEPQPEPEPVAIAETEIESGAGGAEEPAATQTVRATVSGAEPVEPVASESVEAAPPEAALAETVEPGETEIAALPPQEAQEPATLESLPAPIPPRFDIVRVEPSGEAVIAGVAAPFSVVELLDGDRVIGRVRADASGSWVIILDRPLALGDHELGLRTESADGQVLLSDTLVVVSIPAPEVRVAEAEAEPEPEAQVPPEPETIAMAEPEPEAQVTPEPEPEAETIAMAEPEPETTVVVEATPDAETIAMAEPEPEAQVTPEPEPEAIAMAEPEPEATVVAEAMPEAETEVETPSAAEPEPEPEAAIVAEPEPETPTVAEPEPEPAALEPDAQVARLPLVVIVPREGGGASRVIQEPASEGLRDQALVLRAVDYDPAGLVVISGQAEPDARIIVYLDETALGYTLAGVDGFWQIAPAQPVSPGLHRLRVDRVDGGGAVLARVETFFSRAELPSGLPEERFVIVQPGNSLWRIARRSYGEGVRYSVIFQANREQIRDPDLIYPGQIFVVPPVN